MTCGHPIGVVHGVLEGERGGEKEGGRENLSDICLTSSFVG